MSFIKTLYNYLITQEIMNELNRTFCDESEADLCAKELAPNAMLTLFFDTYSKEDAKKRLWDLLYTSFSSETASDWDSQTRSDYLYFYQQMDQLINISYKLSDKNKTIDVSCTKPHD